MTDVNEFSVERKQMASISPSAEKCVKTLLKIKSWGLKFKV